MNREQLNSSVVREILALIATEAYADGRRLPPERDLCKRFGVSRGTLRKALANLAELGAVSVRHGSGTYVEKVSQAALPEDLLPPGFGKVVLDDIIEARKAIELAAIERACGNITEKQCRELEALLEEMAAAVDDLPGFLKLDMRFHQAIVRASGNQVLVMAFEAIYEYHRFSSVFTSQREGEEAVALNFHRKLLAALEKGNAKTGRCILEEHLDDMKKYG